MNQLFQLFADYYIIVLGLQAVSVIHCIRRGTQQKWIWIIVFLPLVGSLAYIFTEIVKRQHINSAQSSIASLVNPGGRIKKLEHNFNFSGTFANRIALADAYLEAGFYDKAIALYEPVLLGNLFDNSDGAIKNLMQAYFKTNRYSDVVKIAPKVINSLDFTKTAANLYFAIALEEMQRLDDAESEYKKMNQKFCNYEHRFHYGSFLLRRNKQTEAQEVFIALINEGTFLSNREKNNASEWIGKAKQELKKAVAVG